MTSEAAIPPENENGLKAAEKAADQHWFKDFLANFPLAKFIRSALIPLSIYYALHKTGRPLWGAGLACAWGLGVLAYVYWKDRKLDSMSIVMSIFVVVALVVTLVTRDPDYFLASASITNAVEALVFLGSILLVKPLLQILAEETMGPGMVPEEIVKSPYYRRAWVLLTAAWGSLFAVRSVVLLAAQLLLPLEAFLLTRLALGWPIDTIMILISFWFPGWYWRRIFDAPAEERAG